MRWTEILFVGCFVIVAFFALLIVLVVKQVQLEPTPVPFHTFAPHLR